MIDPLLPKVLSLSIYLPERFRSPTDDRFHLIRGGRETPTRPTTSLGLRPRENLKGYKRGCRKLNLGIIPARGKVKMEGLGTQTTDTTNPN